MPFQPTQTEQEYEVTRERIPATPAYMSILRSSRNGAREWATSHTA